VAGTEDGFYVLSTLISSCGVWEDAPAEGQSLENFMARRAVGLFILKLIRKTEEQEA